MSTDNRDGSERIRWFQEFTLDRDSEVVLQVGQSIIFAAEMLHCRHFMTTGLENLNDHKNLSFTVRITKAEYEDVESILNLPEEPREEDEEEERLAPGDGDGKKASDDEKGTTSNCGNGPSEALLEKRRKALDELELEPPSTVIQLLQGVIQYASKGNVVYAGGTTRLDPARGAGFFGRQDFRAVMYVPCPLFNIPEDVLHGVPLTYPEFQVLEKFGAVRVMAALGHQFRFFPTAPWIDVNRESFLGNEGSTEDQVEAYSKASILGKMGVRLSPGPNRPGIYGYLEAGVDAAGKQEINHAPTGMIDESHISQPSQQRCVLYYNDQFAEYLLRSQDAVLGAKMENLGIQLSMDADAKRILVFDHKKTQGSGFSAISHPNASEYALSLMGNFVVFTCLPDDDSRSSGATTAGGGGERREQKLLGARMVEDGFFIFLNCSMAKFLSKITSKESLSIDAPHGAEGMVRVKIVYAPKIGGVNAEPGVKSKSKSEMRQKELEEVEAIKKEFGVADETKEDGDEQRAKEEEEEVEDEDAIVVPLQIQLDSPDEQCARAMSIVGQEQGMEGMALGVKELENTLGRLLTSYFKLDRNSHEEKRKRSSPSSSTTTSAGAGRVVELADGQSIEDVATSQGALTESQVEELDRLSGSAVIIEVVLDHQKAPSLGLGWKPSEKEVSRVREGKSAKKPAPEFLSSLADTLFAEKEAKEGAAGVLPQVACEMKFTCLFGINLK